MWERQKRQENTASRERRLSPSNGTDNAWAIVEPPIPAATPGGRPQDIEGRDIVNGLFSVLRRGGPWRRIPQEVPWRTVSLSVRAWTAAGMWEQIHAARRRDGRIRAGRDPEPRTAMLDRPSIATSAVRGDARREEGGKNHAGPTTTPAGRRAGMTDRGTRAGR